MVKYRFRIYNKYTTIKPTEGANMSKILIIGLGSGGFAASLAIRRTDQEALITIVEKRTYEMFSPCGLPFAIEGIVNLDDLKFSLPEDKQVTKMLGYEARIIDVVKKVLTVTNLKTEEMISIPYDSLIIAFGAKPYIPPIKIQQNIGNGVFVLHDIESAQKIIDCANNIKRAVVVGAGLIGLEIAVALHEKSNFILLSSSDFSTNLAISLSRARGNALGS